MLIQEKIAVAAIVLAAAVHLGRLVVSKYRRRTPDIACGGGACAGSPGANGSLTAKRVNGSGRSSGIFRSQR